MIERRDLEFQIAQLRHAYAQLARSEVRDQPEFARGLIAPAIRLLEALALPGKAGMPDRNHDADLRSLRQCATLLRNNGGGRDE